MEKSKFDMNKEACGSHGGADQKILDDFISMCNNKSEPRSGLEDGRLAVKLSLAATESSENKYVLKL